MTASSSAATRRVVVTGAAGNIGRALVDAYLARGAEVTAIDLAELHDPRVHALRADLTRPGDWEQQLAGADLVLHAAAIVAESGDRDRFVAVNVLGARRVAEAAAEAGVARLVHLSSIVVYGNRWPAGSLRTESDPLVPTGAPYTDTKIAAEHAVLAVAAERDLAVTIVRPGDVYGPRSVPWVLRPLALMRRRQFLLIDGGRWPLSPIHLDDLVTGILAAGDAEVAAGRTYNLAGPPVSARSFFTHHARHTGTRLRSLPRPAALAAAELTARAAALTGRSAPFGPEAIEYVTHPGGYAGDRAARELGVGTTIPLEQGLPACLVAADQAGELPPM